ncbi:MAG: bacillithiol system redox-active protein YtxJ [Gemmatimonadales bacterium]|nr:bacillithiol system redox-active protein YtxJ [Gemmatimonadales bacterium]
MPLAPLDAESAARWLAALPETSLTLLYKHSTRCGVSLDARVELGEFVAAHPEVTAWQVDVLRQRPLSQEFARLLDIPHQSPQVILLRGGRPLWHTSHQRITRAALAERLAAARAG